MSDTFGDAVYEAWRRGLNPDAVDADRIWYDEAQCYEPEEAISRELRIITPPRPAAGNDELEKE